MSVLGYLTTAAPTCSVVPMSVRAIAADRQLRLAWENEVGGRTFEVGTGADRCFVKWSPTTSGIDLADEAARLSCAAAFTPVPGMSMSTRSQVDNEQAHRATAG